MLKKMVSGTVLLALTLGMCSTGAWADGTETVAPISEDAVQAVINTPIDDDALNSTALYVDDVISRWTDNDTDEEHALATTVGIVQLRNEWARLKLERAQTHQLLCEIKEKAVVIRQLKEDARTNGNIRKLEKAAAIEKEKASIVKKIDRIRNQKANLWKTFWIQMNRHEYNKAENTAQKILVDKVAINHLYKDISRLMTVEIGILK